MKIHQNDLGDILKTLPDEEDFVVERTDFMICTLGFEERTYAVVEGMLSDNLSNLKNLILVTYPTNKGDNDVNRPKFEKLKSYNINVFEINYEKTSFYNLFLQFLRDKVPSGAKVIFDISTCSSYLFYPIMKALLELDISLIIAYAEASEYDPSKENWEKVAEKAEKEKELFIKSWDEADFQSIGVDDVYGSNLFSEMNPGNKPSILIAIPNFNSIRMQSIKEKDKEVNKTELSDIFWLIGVPPRDENKWRGEALLKTNALEKIDDKNKWFVSTLHYKDSIKQLEAIWINNRYSSHISIGTLGSKMQHLATFFFIYLHPDTGLWLAEPRKFKAGTYSTGVRQLYRINFGDTKAMREQLSKYMHFEYQF
jgi:hypothetical protein